MYAINAATNPSLVLLFLLLPTEFIEIFLRDYFDIRDSAYPDAINMKVNKYIKSGKYKKNCHSL